MSATIRIRHIAHKGDWILVKIEANWMYKKRKYDANNGG